MVADIALDAPAGHVLGSGTAVGDLGVLISGLLPWEEQAANRLVDDYAARRQNAAVRSLSTA